MAAVAWFGVSTYAVLGGIHLGTAIWDLRAPAFRHPAHVHAFIDAALGRVWVLSGLWLVFAVVVAHVALPASTEAFWGSLWLPASAAAVTLVVRSGCSLVAPSLQGRARSALASVAGAAAIVGAFGLGLCLGAVASGRVEPDADPGPFEAWLNPTSISVGVFAVLVCAFVAAVAMALAARKADDPVLTSAFRGRAVVSCVLAGLASAAGAVVLFFDARWLFDRLMTQGLVFVILAVVLGLVTLRRCQKGGPDVPQGTAIATVVAVVWAWGVAQYPYALAETMHLDEAATTSTATLVVTFVVAVVVAIPLLAGMLVIFRRTQRSRLGRLSAPEGHELHRVVIVGGGFAGMVATRALAMAPARVTLVDRRNHHLFQPMLYQVATGIVSEGAVAPALRHVFARQGNVSVELAEVTGFDLEAKVVHTELPNGVRRDLPYDHLVVGTGCSQSYFGHDEMAAFAPGMKTLEDSLEVRRRVFGAFEMAESAEDEQGRRGWLTFVVVGAGPTGVELSGQIADLAHRTLRGEFRSADPTTARVLLVDGGTHPLASFGEQLAGRAERALAKVGVEVRMGVRATAIDAAGIELTAPDGSVERIEARTVLWAAGVAASPLAGMLAEATGAETDRAGRIRVQPDCTLPGHPEVFAVGDMMALDDLPGVAEVAMQQGLHAAATILRRLRGRNGSKPFRYVDMGSMAMVSRGNAVVDFKGLRLAGLGGFVLWLMVHLTFLTTYRSRISALTRWVGSFLGRGRDERALVATGREYPGGGVAWSGSVLNAGPEPVTLTASSDGGPTNPGGAPPPGS